MKNIGLIASVVVCAAVMTGCISTNTSDSGNLTLNPQVTGPLDEYRPLYKVDETKTVSGNAKMHWCLGFSWGANGYADYVNTVSADDSIFAAFLPRVKNAAMKAAYYEACEANNCDAIIASRYKIKTKDYFVYAQYDITINGYPAVQTGLETVKAVPYYIDPNGKLVTLEKFTKMYNVLPCTKTAVKVSDISKKGWLSF